MNTIEIINKIIEFGNDDSNIPVFLKVKDKKNYLEIHDAITDLLFWQKTVHRALQKGKTLKNFSMFNLEQFNIQENKNIYDDLFKNIKELKHLFIIKGNVIVLNPSLVKDEVKELRQIIEDKFKVDLHT
ncbi:hypothetical protein [Chryseobacterium sp. JK1]|uniref:hypothetical protein n=1 Tax=Chryseobacterium sp. JK1 TaxID=874294 RepID=UPI003D684579